MPVTFGFKERGWNSGNCELFASWPKRSTLRAPTRAFLSFILRHKVSLQRMAKPEMEGSDV